MKLLFDQNISHRVLKLLTVAFTNSTTIKQENLIDSSDKNIWEFAKKNDFIIVTQDSDFNDLNSLYGFPPKIIWIRTGNLRTDLIATILNEHASEIEEFSKDSGYGCFEILALKK
jgi:predicted nuclease of predicted toxin-antitoxin system